MLDAHNIYRKVSRVICDFSPEQQKNIAAIVWLYRGQHDRFLKLVVSYLLHAIESGKVAQKPLGGFEDAFGKLTDLIEPFTKLKREGDPLAEPWDELTSVQATMAADIDALGVEAELRAKGWASAARDNPGLNAAREDLHTLADQCRDLVKQIDLAAKLAARVVDIAVNELEARESDLWDNADVNRARKAMEAGRSEAVEALRRARYFVRQADWLQERFPEARLRDVDGLVKLVSRSNVAAQDWSLTPSRFIGVAPEEVDEEFDFEEALGSIHIDLKGLNEEAIDLAARIAKNFEELGV
jgi:type I restriction enzyme M protein